MISVVSTLPKSANTSNEVMPPWGNIEFNFDSSPNPEAVDIRIYDSQNLLIERFSQVTTYAGIDPFTTNLNGTAYYRVDGTLVIDPSTRLSNDQVYNVKIAAGSFYDQSADINLWVRISGPNTAYLEPATYVDSPSGGDIAYCVPTGKDGIYKVLQVTVGLPVGTGGIPGVNLMSRYGGQGIFVASNQGYAAGIGFYYDVAAKAFRLPTWDPFGAGLTAIGASTNEGASASFTLQTVGVPTGTTVTYSISGVSLSDVSGGLTGSAIIDRDGKATLSIPISADGLTEGSETLTVSVLGYTKAITIVDTSTSTSNSNPVCFARGTLIQTASGPAPVEELQIGDRLSFYVTPTLIDSAKVKWIGRQTFHPAMAELVDYLPIKISANALGPGQPFKDLYVSPDHAILFDGTLIHAKALVNGTSIVQMTEWDGNVEYFHIETESHELVYANGVPAETFIDNVTRKQFDNYAEFEAMYSSAPMMTELDIPRVLFRRQLSTATVQRLNALKEVWVARYSPSDVATESV